LRKVTAALFLGALLPSAVVAQPTRDGVITLSLDTRLHPAVYVLGGAAAVEVFAGLSAYARGRQVWGDYGCTERTPTPCSMDGFGVGLGLYYSSPTAAPWSPYIDVSAGGHRYTDYATKPFVAFGLGIAWHLGTRGSLRIGFQYERLQADPAYWPIGDSAYNTGGVSMGLGLGVG
jgi:hypothetical protein